MPWICDAQDPRTEGHHSCDAQLVDSSGWKRVENTVKIRDACKSISEKRWESFNTEKKNGIVILK